MSAPTPVKHRSVGAEDSVVHRLFFWPIRAWRSVLSADHRLVPGVACLVLGYRTIERVGAGTDRVGGYWADHQGLVVLILLVGFVLLLRPALSVVTVGLSLVSWVFDVGSSLVSWVFDVSYCAHRGTVYCLACSEPNWPGHACHIQGRSRVSKHTRKRTRYGRLGVLRKPIWVGVVVDRFNDIWSCGHSHEVRTDALRCAAAELRRMQTQPGLLPPIISARPRPTTKPVRLPIEDLSAAQWDEMKRDHGGACHYCRRTDLQLEKEHRIPLSRGGPNHKANIVPSCGPCNRSKGTLTDIEFIDLQNKKAQRKRRPGSTTMAATTYLPPRPVRTLLRGRPLRPGETTWHVSRFNRLRERLVTGQTEGAGAIPTPSARVAKVLAGVLRRTGLGVVVAAVRRWRSQREEALLRSLLVPSRVWEGLPPPGRSVLVVHCKNTEKISGISFHSDAVERVLGKDSSWKGRVVLVPEPGNKHDSHAVAVFSRGDHVGYLSKAVARSVQSDLMVLLKVEKTAVATKAEISRWEHGYAGKISLGLPLRTR